jgi:AcrR family transcriptional regulator
MPGAVKPKRPYHSPRRQEQAAATRRAIIEAAERLFERTGYVATTMEAIAADAGVALKTVYLAFETKSRLLRAVWDYALKGDESDAPVADRSWYREVLEEPDPERQLRLNARNSRVVKTRIAGLLAAIREGAPTDADLGALWQLIQTDFHDNQRAIVRELDRKGALAPHLDVDRATDILWTLNHPDVWLLLAGKRGWSPEQFEEWFADTACAQLLRPSSPRRVRGRARQAGPRQT